MKVQYPAGSKREWYDRNPNVINQLFTNAYAPHVQTQRLQYTIPANKKAFVQSVGFYVVRTTAATTAADCGILLQHYDGASSVVVLQDIMNDNTVNKPFMIQQMFQFYALAGQTLTLYTWDASTGGQVAYQGQFSLVYFDN